MVAETSVAVYSVVGVALFLVVAVVSALVGFWYFKKSSASTQDEEPEPRKEKVRLTGTQSKIRLYNQNETGATAKAQIVNESRNNEKPKSSGDKKSNYVKRVSGKVLIASAGDNTKTGSPYPVLGIGKDGGNRGGGEADSNDTAGKTSTPVIEGGSTPRGGGGVERYFMKKFAAGGTERVSEGGDTPASFVEPLTGPFSEDKPYVVAYADLMSVTHVPPYPITEEASNVLSSQNPDSCDSSHDPMHLFKKQPQPQLRKLDGRRSRPPADAPLDCPPDADVPPPAGGNKKDRRLHKIMSQTQKAVSDARNVIANLTKSNSNNNNSSSNTNNAATIDESTSESTEMNHEGVSLSSPEGNSCYYSEYSVTISPEVDLEPRGIASEPGAMSTAPKSTSPPPNVPPNFVITYKYGDSTNESGQEGVVEEVSMVGKCVNERGPGDDEGRGEDREEEQDASSVRGGVGVAEGSASIDMENNSSSTLLLSKASRKSIVSVAFATCNETSTLAQQDHDQDGLTSATPDEPSRSMSEDGRSEELSMVAPNPNPHSTAVDLEGEAEGVGIKIDMNLDTDSPPASIVIAGTPPPHSRNNNSKHSNDLGICLNDSIKDTPAKKRVLSKTPFAYIRTTQTSSSAECDFGDEGRDEPLDIAHIRQYSTDFDTEHDNSVHLIDSTRSVGGSDPFLGSRSAPDTDENAPGTNRSGKPTDMHSEEEN